MKSLLVSDFNVVHKSSPVLQIFVVQNKFSPHLLKCIYFIIPFFFPLFHKDWLLKSSQVFPADRGVRTHWPLRAPLIQHPQRVLQSQLRVHTARRSSGNNMHRLPLLVLLLGIWSLHSYMGIINMSDIKPK